MTTKENAQQKLRDFTAAASDLLTAMEEHEHATGEPFGTEAYPFPDSLDDVLHAILDWRDANAPLYKTQTVALEVGGTPVITLELPVPIGGNETQRALNLRIIERAEEKVIEATGIKPLIRFTLPYDPRG